MPLTITVTADLDAPRAAVWDALTDLASWEDWNPHVVQASGALVEGGRLALRIRTPGGGTMRFRPRVVEVDHGRAFAWLGRVGVRGLFDGRHAFALEDLPGGRTRVVQSERFTGLLVRPLRRTVADAETSFAAVHAALAERLAAQPVPSGR